VPGRRGRQRLDRQDDSAEPFATAADAWFLVHGVPSSQRRWRARVVAGLARIARPCEPGDIHRLVARLYRARRLRSRHLRAQIRYRRMMLPPDPGRPDGRRELQDWHEALAELEHVLRAKGFVR
jgi:hypothetical protein